MTGYGNSAAREAAAIRARARKGVWRRLTAALGVSQQARVADARAARWAHGAAGEIATVGLLAQLPEGWQVRHDVRLQGRRFNLDHVLIAPEGTVVVLDTKTWHRGRAHPTTVVGGRVHCGTQDRHEQVEKVAEYAACVQRALALPGVVVWPLLVVHGSWVAGGELAVRAPAWDGVVYVMGSARLVPRLAAGVRAWDPGRAAVVAARAAVVLRPYGAGG